ncbi:hypothetical protein Tco_1045012 [Tanacetum coccineum]|uniref:Uncharacterized protein n=1 Tax=Tanacetum coccineum TaxID=301880 RepID=A0ABQ5GRJ2_9ASTR
MVVDEGEPTGSTTLEATIATRSRETVRGGRFSTNSSKKACGMMVVNDGKLLMMILDRVGDTRLEMIEIASSSRLSLAHFLAFLESFHYVSNLCSAGGQSILEQLLNVDRKGFADAVNALTKFMFLKYQLEMWRMDSS